MRIRECACDLATRINEAVNMAREAVKSISVNGKDYSPDGTGKVDLGTITATVNASGVDMTDGRDVETAIEALDDEVGSETDAGSILYRIKQNETAITDETTARQNEDTQLASDIADNATAIANETAARSDADNTLQTAIDEINGSIATNTANIASNKTEIDANATAIAGKQDALTAGTGISITDGTIACTVDTDDCLTSVALQVNDSDILVNGTSNTSTVSNGHITVGDGLSIVQTEGIVNEWTIANAGVTSIIAGDNITVDNSTGAVTISAAASDGVETWRAITADDIANMDSNDRICIRITNTDTGMYCYKPIYTINTDGTITISDSNTYARLHFPAYMPLYVSKSTSNLVAVQSDYETGYSADITLSDSTTVNVQVIIHAIYYIYIGSSGSINGIGYSFAEQINSGSGVSYTAYPIPTAVRRQSINISASNVEILD